MRLAAIRWNNKIEQAFPYTETQDQLRSVAEIKEDMQKDKPMDRLLVGDVGYGKTEVAMRAVFKAVMDGKQAAVLVPTTILAEQHYENFVQRFSDYPFTIGLLSRFRSKKKNKKKRLRSFVRVQSISSSERTVCFQKTYSF